MQNHWHKSQITTAATLPHFSVQVSMLKLALIALIPFPCGVIWTLAQFQAGSQAYKRAQCVEKRHTYTSNTTTMMANSIVFNNLQFVI